MDINPPPVQCNKRKCDTAVCDNAIRETECKRPCSLGDCDTRYFCRKIVTTDVGQGDSEVDAAVPLYKLGDDVIVTHIFSRFSRRELLKTVCLVCRHWHSLCFWPDLWRVLDLHAFPRVNNTVLMRLTRISSHPREIDLSDNSNVTDFGLSVALATCPELGTLKINRMQHINSHGLLCIAKSTPHLRSLHMACSVAVTDEVITKIAQGCSDLRVLRLSQCSLVTSQGVCAIAAFCHDMRKLYLDQCPKVDDVGVQRLVEGCPNLELIGLMGCSLSAEGVLELQKLSRLRDLELSNIATVRDHVVVSIAQACRQLESLNLSLCAGVTDRAVEAACQLLPRLKALTLVSCDVTDRGLEAMGRHGASLQHVDVGWCHKITNTGVLAVAAGCRSLRHLGLMRCDHVDVLFSVEMTVRFPHVTFSTMWLDCRRLVERANREGLLQNASQGLLST